MGDALFRVPLGVVKFRAQNFVHIKIAGVLIPFSGAEPVPFRTSRDISCDLNGFLLHRPAHDKFLLLLRHAVSLYVIPQRHFPKRLIRYIRGIRFRTHGTDPLETDQQSFPVRKDPAHRQGMGILRSEAMDKIRLNILHDLAHHVLQRGIINLGVKDILEKAVAVQTCVFPPDHLFADFVVFREQNFRRRKSNGQFHPVFLLFFQNNFQKTRYPALFVRRFQIQLFRYHRYHYVAKPQYLHTHTSLTCKGVCGAHSAAAPQFSVLSSRLQYPASVRPSLFSSSADTAKTPLPRTAFFCVQGETGPL